MDEKAKKQENIRTIVELLMKAPADKVADLIVFIKSFLSQIIQVKGPAYWPFFMFSMYCNAIFSSTILPASSNCS